jgi:hypothetical protein
VGKGVASTRAVPLMETRPVAGLASADGSASLPGKDRRDRPALPLEQTLALARAAQKKGDLTRAEPALYRAHVICQEKLGPTHPATQWALRNLADCYQVALNTAPLAVAAKVTPARGGYSIAWGRQGERAGAPFLYGAYSSTAANPYLSATNPYLSPAGVASPSGAPPAPPAATRPGSPARRAERSAVRPADQRYASALALRQRITSLDAGTVKTSVVPVLANALLRAATPGERAALARALGELGPAARDALPVLVQCLRAAREPQECRAVLLALGEVGPVARPLRPLEFARQASAAGLPVREVRRWLEGRIGVNDGGECFSVLALRQSCREIRNLALTSDVDVLIETVPALGGEGERSGRASGSKERARLRGMGPRALYVLFARKGPEVRVLVSDTLRREGFSGARLARELKGRLVSKETARKGYDEALLESVRSVIHFEKQRRQTK